MRMAATVIRETPRSLRFEAARHCQIKAEEICRRANLPS